MANQWFRMYAEFATDPKVQMMSEAFQRRLLMLLCMRCGNDLVTLHDEEVAFQLRISNAEWVETKAAFIAKGFIDSKLNLLNWEKRQFKSDSSKERVAKHRAKAKAIASGDVTLQERPSNALEQNRTDTDIEAKASSSAAALPDCPHAELIDLFAAKLPMLPQPKPELWSGARAKALKARWVWVLTAKKRNGDRYATDKQSAIDFFARFFDYVSGSDFLSGRNGQWTGCDLAWLANETNFAKVMQGNYDNKTTEVA